MNKTLLATLCTSMVALNGCAAALEGLVNPKGQKAKQWENESLEEALRVAAATEKEHGELAESVEDLAKAYNSWMYTYSLLETFRDDDEYNGIGIGTCDDAKRKTSKNCKTAAAEQKKIIGKISAIVAASLELDPEPGSDFPAGAITESQEHPAIAAAIDVEASLTKLTQQWSTYWTRRMKKAGGAASLVRKEGTGMCFFSDSPHGKDIKPEFAFGSATEDLFIRCVAPDALRSYQRTQHDTVKVRLLGKYAPSDSDSQFNVKDFSVDEPSGTETMEMDFAASLLRKTVKNTLLDENLRKYYKGWRFILVNVQYVVSKKTGERAVRRGSDQVDFEDEIESNPVAGGFAVLQLDGGGEAPDDDGAEASDERGETDEDEVAQSNDEDDSEARPAKRKQSKAKKERTKTKRTAQRSKRRSKR